MSPVLENVARFDFDRLFNGAVDVDWLISDSAKADRAANAFVFHGPSYHGVSQQDVVGTGHKLIDSASFFKTTIDHLASEAEHPFSLAIANFGSGKSHMAVTLAKLLETDDPELRKNILSNVGLADEEIRDHLKEQIPSLARKVLVITINGMNNFDLAAEVLKQIRRKFELQGVPTEALDNLRKRFHNAASILQNLDETRLSPLLAELDVASKEAVLEKLSSFDETIYARVHEFLDSLGIPLIAIGDETIKDILNLLTNKYVGKDKTYKKILIIFDEFGHYTKFATTHSQIAGNGALQHLFEGVQENADKISFVGFIQFDLKTYEQRLSSEYRNEIRRFITRFQAAEKYYLSINLETLIASLLIKSKGSFVVPQSVADDLYDSIHNWFPAAKHHTLWNDKPMFDRVIAEGCFPLSPLSVWFLFHLSAGGQYLQQRSALALLKSALEANSKYQLSPETPYLPPVCLWTEDMQREFEEIEEQTGRRAIVQSYKAVLDRSGQHLEDAEIKILRSIVLVTQSQLKAKDRKDALIALKAFSGLEEASFEKALQRLENEWNVITWDDSFHMFDILGDSVSKSQFLKYLKRKVDEEYDFERQSKLFIKYANRFPDYLGPVECGFADEKSIMTPEWVYEPRYTFWSALQAYVTGFVKDLRERSRFNAVDNPRGLVVYCFVDATLDHASIILEAKKLLKSAMREGGDDQVPIILTLLCDEGDIGKTLSEIDVIESMPMDVKETYSRLAPGHLSKQMEALKEKIQRAMLRKNYITILSDEAIPRRIANLGQTLFEKLFPKVLSFPFDGYKSQRTNAAQDCADFTRKLMFQPFTFDNVTTMQVRQKNRMTMVLKESWKAFNRDGTVASLAGSAQAKAIESDWDKYLYGEKKLNGAVALQHACASPYGANIASAGLLLAVYLQARRTMLSTVLKGELIELATVADKLFDGSILSLAVLKEIEFIKNETDSSEWERFLTEWDNATSYADRISYSEKADEIERRISIPIQLRWKHKALKDTAKDAKNKIEEMLKIQEDALLKMDQGKNKRDAFIMSQGAAKIFDCTEVMKRDQYWPQDEILNLLKLVDIAKQFVVQNFKFWVEKQVPMSNTTIGVTDFKNKLLGQASSYLKKLQLQELQEQLVKHVESITRNFDAVASCQQVINEFNNWINTASSIPSDITYSQIQALYGTIKNHEESLSSQKRKIRPLNQSGMMAELEARSEQINQFRKSVKQKEKEIKERTDAIWDSELSTQTAENLLGQILECERVYVGDESNLEEFRTMKSVIQAFVNYSRQFNQLQMSESDFEVQKKSARAEFISRFKGSDPPWDLSETFDKMIKECEKHRNNAAKDWFENIQERAAELTTMTSQQADELLRLIQAVPPYFCGDAYEKKLAVLANKIEKHLDSKGVEWLYERYTQLSPTAQKSFLSLVKGKK